jgi:methyl-accepting chemotaxis protein
VGEVQRAVNASLDITDAFVREAGGAMAAAAEGRFYRTVLLRGLPGAYQNAAKAINTAGAEMRARAGAMLELADSFERSVGAVASGVAEAAGTVHGNAGQLSRMAADSHAQATTAAGATQGMAGDTNAVAAATEELSASISEISRQVGSASGIAREAVARRSAPTPPSARWPRARSASGRSCA